MIHAKNESAQKFSTQVVLPKLFWPHIFFANKIWTNIFFPAQKLFELTFLGAKNVWPQFVFCQIFSDYKVFLFPSLSRLVVSSTGIASKLSHHWLDLQQTWNLTSLEAP